MKILCIIDFYIPGYKAGGPIRTLANMVARLEDEFKFKIVTTDRDLNDTKPYPGIKTGSWNRVGKAEVFYLSPPKRSLRGFRRLFFSTKYDILYLNSFFSPHFTIKPLLPRRLRMISDPCLIIAPRGEFSPGAIGLKSLKKKMYIRMVKVLGLYKNAVWQASSEHEEYDIRRWFGKDVSVKIAPNIPPGFSAGDGLAEARKKEKGCLKIIFLSRVSRKKNLAGALKMLKGLKGEIEFNIYGPIEDKLYWLECQKLISGLSENIEVRYCSSVVHNEVGTVLRKHDLFFFPTLGENFGHVILEAFCAGCPVLISDQTPWRDLVRKNVGWDLLLAQPVRFKAVLQKCIDMDYDEHAKLSKLAREYGLQVTQNNSVLEQNRQLFYRAVAMTNDRQEKMHV